MPPMSALTVLIAGSTVVDILVGVVLLWRYQRAGGVGVRELARVGLGTCVSFVLKLPVIRCFGLNGFGMIHLTYLALVVTMPLLGAATLGLGLLNRRRGRRLRPVVVAAAIATFAACGAGVYATFVEPFRLQVTQAALTLPPSRAGVSEITLGVIADLQASSIGSYEHRAIETLMAQRPDLVLIAGDVFQGSDAEFERWLPELRRLFSKLDAPGGVFLVPGDVDQSPGRLERLVEHTRVRLLRNAVAQVVVNDRRITLAGLELDVWSDDAEARLGELQRSADAEDIRIVLSHRPDSVLRLDANSRVDLVVAGHTHGGQVCVPGFGPPMTLTRVPRYAAAGGLHDVGGNAVFVSRGVGCERGQAPRVRFFCPPEVAVVRLTSAKRADANHTLTSED